MIAALLLSLNIGAMVTSASEIVPFGMTCSCGGSLNGRKTSYGAWATYASTPCTVKTAYYDSKQKRTVYTTYTCNKCGYQVTQKTGTGYRTICPFNAK